MPPFPLDVPPGFLKVDSSAAAGGRIIDGDKVRFVRRRVEKWAGWNRLIATALNGKARGAVSWNTQYFTTDAAFGTHLKLYSLTGSDTLGDITPVRSTGTLGNNPFATTAASVVVTVTHVAHGANDKDFVTFAGAAAVAGITIAGEYQLTRIDNDSYTITHSVAANATTAGGGAAVTYSYQINTGLADGAVGFGFGAGPYGASTYGTARSTGVAIEIRTWSLSEYANNLLASPSGGGLYYWRDGTDTVALVVSNAPTAIRAMFVTPEGFIFALGTTTAMTVQWADQIDKTLWTPASNNTANNRTLSGGSRLMGGMGVVDGVSLVWSDTTCFLFQYTGSNLVYDSRIVGDSSGLAGPLARAKHMGVAYWMSPQCRFQMYTGFAQNIPNAEDIRAFVLKDIDTARITKTWARYDANHNQIRWHYCSLDSATTEPDKYVDVSLNGEFEWTTGTLDRTTGTQFRPSDGSNLLVSSDGYIYSHDEGHDANGSALEAYITYGPRQAAQGQGNIDIMGVIPDVERQTGALTYELTSSDRPDSASSEDSTTLSLDPTDIIGDARLNGRLIGLTIRSNVLGGDFRLGIPSLEIQDAGERR